MLDQVILLSDIPHTLNVTSVSPDEILVLKSISGLSSVKVNLFVGDYSRDGGYYQGRRSDKKNYVMKLKMNPDYAEDIEVSDIRELLYTMFFTPTLTGDGLPVLLKDDRKPDRYFVGYAEDMDTDMWARTQEAQVSLLSVDPWLFSATPFEWTNPAGSDEETFMYDGSAPTGMELEIKILANTNQVVVSLNHGTHEMVLVHPTGNFLTGKTIYIGTTAGSRYIIYDGLDVMAMLQGADWLELRGQRTFLMETWGDAMNDNKAVLTMYKYRSRWWGI